MEKDIKIFGSKVDKESDVVAFMALGFVSRGEYNRKNIDSSKPFQMVSKGNSVFECDPIVYVGSLDGIKDNLIKEVENVVCQFHGKKQ